VTRVVIAPDSFKGSISAIDAAAAIARGWASVRGDDELVHLPMADGGEGTVEAFASANPGAVRMPATVTGPDDRPVAAEWLQLPDGTAVIELAASSGLHLLDPLRPLDAHTFGFGELIAAALDAGAQRLVLGLGGSATTDGGAGALTALGARFLDRSGTAIRLGNRGLGELGAVDLSDLRTPPEGSLGLSDVTNGLLGPLGAARVFGPQKGAAPDDLELMDQNLARLARVLDQRTLAAQDGAGAAGGVGFGLLVWGVPLAPGARSVGELIGLPAAIAGAALVITGEGRFDAQTASGKVAHYVANLAERASVPVAIVAGVLDAPTEAFADAVSLTHLAGSTTAAIADSERWLTAAGAALATRAERGSATSGEAQFAPGLPRQPHPFRWP
jgi:glycerate 2-kinase